MSNATNHGTIHILELILTGLGSLIVIFLGIQIRQIFNMNSCIKKVQAKLDSHILHMANELPKRVAVADCASVRRDCIELNKTIILRPLEEQLQSMRVKCKENYITDGTEKNKIWHAIHHHSHTNISDHTSDKVILEK